MVAGSLLFLASFVASGLLAGVLLFFTAGTVLLAPAAAGVVENEAMALELMLRDNAIRISWLL